MLTRALDIESVQAFVLTVDLASFTRAAEALETSQAGISLRLKRLEDRLGCRLVDRTPRNVRASARGERFLPAARDLIAAHERAMADLVAAPPARLVLGISDHVAGPDLPALLHRLGLAGSGLVVEVRIAPSRDLMRLFEAGEVDAVIVRSEDPAEAGGTVLAEERLAWFAAPGFRFEPGAPLPMATLAGPCNVRAAALRALDGTGLAWNEVFIGGGVLAVGAAVTAGLAVAALAPSVAPAGARDVGAAFGLPALPVTRIVLHAQAPDPRAAAVLRTLAAAYRGVAR